jgi:hypothetical protein
MSKETGGAAFPSTQDQWERGMEGMTLRDWFAGQALSGLLAKYNLNAPSDQNTLAQMSYELADAMLAERSKE